MGNKSANNNSLELPQELVPLLMESLVCEYASIKSDGTPITSPLIPSEGMNGQAIDVNTGLTYPWKAERARRNPNVCLLYSEPAGMAGKLDAVVLVYGQATVHDSDLQGNTDRYVRMVREQSSLFRKMPLFALQFMVGYIARIWVAITPLKILWWFRGDMAQPPQQWQAPPNTRIPESDPPPLPYRRVRPSLNIPPDEWRASMEYALGNLGLPVLTVVDDEGYPVPFRTVGGRLVEKSVLLNVLPNMPAKPVGRACLTFHNIKIQSGEMVANENLSFIGNVSESGSTVLFEVERELPSASFKRGLMDMISLGKMMVQMRKRVQAEAERRGQVVPIVRLIERKG